MRSVPSRRRSGAVSTLVLAGLAIFVVGCSDEDDPLSPVGSSEPVQPGVVNNFVNGLPDWEVPSDVEAPPVPLEDEEALEEMQYYRCEATRYDMRRNFESIVAVGANATALKPGMMVQGTGVRDGSLSTIGLARSPLELSINLAVEDPSRVVENPNSASIQDAIAELQREADTRFGESIPVVPAQINFRAETAYSFEQAMMSAGISLSYDAVFASGSVSTAFSQQSSVQQQSVIVKLMQPMYTISFADDALAEPADFFHESVTEADFQRQRELGTMGAGNQPCYVQSVTYGRMVVYTVTSTQAASASQLRAAVQASYGAYEGSGDYNESQRQLVSNSTIEIQIFGGTQEDALESMRSALADGDFGAFLREVPATTAVPLSYRINDLKNRQPAVIGDATEFTIRECEPVTDLLFTVSLDSITVVNGCTSQDEFDIECYAYPTGGDTYWLLHNDGSFFPREELPQLNNQTIFPVTAGAETEVTVFTGVYGGSGGTYGGWSRETVFSFPFDFDTNPHSFSHIDTGSNDAYENCTLEIHYTIHRALE
jgi:hypothetical protein